MVSALWEAQLAIVMLLALGGPVDAAGRASGGGVLGAQGLPSPQAAARARRRASDDKNRDCAKQPCGSP